MPNEAPLRVSDHRDPLLVARVQRCEVPMPADPEIVCQDVIGTYVQESAGNRSERKSRLSFYPW